MFGSRCTEVASQNRVRRAGRSSAIVAGGRIASLYVNSYNTVARAAYAKVGFAQVGTFATVLLD